MSCAKVNLGETEKNSTYFQIQMEWCAKAAQETHTAACTTGTMDLDSILCQAMKACMETSSSGTKFQGGLPKSNTFLAYTWHYLARRAEDIQ